MKPSPGVTGNVLYYSGRIKKGGRLESVSLAPKIGVSTSD